MVLHQTGRDRDQAVREHYARLGIAAEVTPFIDDMASRYRESDLVICRSGATSCSELCAAGAAAVLVPFIAKTTRHQLGNAKYLADRGAAWLVEQPEFTAERVAALIEEMTRERILKVAKAARAIASPDAAGKVADLIESTLAAREAQLAQNGR